MTRSDGDTLATWLKRTTIAWTELCEKLAGLAVWNDWPEVVEQVVLEAKYAGYIDRQSAEVERFRKLENKPIPGHLDYAGIPQMRVEAREKLGRIRPANLGQASRVSGITPADLAVLLFYLE